MQDGILIVDNEKVAASYHETTWKPKYDIQKEEKVDEAAPGSGALAGVQKKVSELLYTIADIPFLVAYKSMILDSIEKAETQPNLLIATEVYFQVQEKFDDGWDTIWVQSEWKKEENMAGEWNHTSGKWDGDAEDKDFEDDPDIYAYSGLKCLGIELWQVKSGSLFDNFLICDDPQYAKKFAGETWGKNKDESNADDDDDDTSDDDSNSETEHMSRRRRKLSIF